MRKHPTAERLALHAGGELPLLEGMAVRWHVRSCAACASEAARMKETRSALRAEAETLPEGLDWESLAEEMRANIRLGLAAGAVVRERRAPGARPEAGWRLAVVLGSMTFVGIAGWMLKAPPAGIQLAHPAAVEQDLVLDVRPEGLAVREQGRALTLMAPTEQPLATKVSWDGGGSARFMDADTGQVTIYDVSAQ